MKGLQKLSTEQLIHLAEPTWAYINIGRMEDMMKKLLERNSPFLKQYVQDQHIIDIGCGKSYNQVNERTISLGAKSYVGIVPHNILTKDLERKGKISFAPTDGLSYLLTQPDNSAVIIASSLFSETLVPILVDTEETKAIKEEYLQRLFRQIYRVTPTVCFGFELFFLAEPYAQEAGFKIEQFHDNKGKSFRTSESVSLGPHVLDDFFILYK